MYRRLALRDLPVRQRQEGLNDERRVSGRRYLRLAGACLLVSIRQRNNGLPSQFMLICSAHFYERYKECAFGPHLLVNPLIHLNRRIHTWSASDFRLKFRFHQNHAIPLMDCLGIDRNVVIVCNNGLTCHPEEAFLIMLHRMASYSRLTDMEGDFGRSYDEISRIFNTMVGEVVARNHYLVFDNVAYFEPRFKIYNAKIRDKLARDGYPLCAAALDTALFVDGTSLEVCRPSGPNINQARVYNGHHHVHCLQFQGCSAPDGMIVDFFGPIAGARHDQLVHDQSTLNERLAACQVENAVQYKAYADKGYVARSHTNIAYRGRDLPQELVDENFAMSPHRVTAEWCFNKIGTEFNYVKNYRIQKIQMCQVGKVYILAALLANAFTILYGWGSRYYDCSPPTLGSYFGLPRYDVSSSHIN